MKKNFTVVAMTGTGTKSAEVLMQEHNLDLDTAIITAVNYAYELGISTDIRLIRDTIATYGKYRHFDRVPCERGRRYVAVIPKG